MQKADEITSKPQEQPQPQIQEPQKMHPLVAINMMTGNLLNIKKHAVMIEQVTGAKIAPIQDNLMAIAQHLDLLRDWMIKELKINPQQPMNRQQIRRMQKQFNKENKSKK